MDPKKRRKLKLAGRVFGTQVLLSAPAVEDAKPFWVQIAQAGLYKGYKSGPVTFDAAMFSKVIANFRAHPWYQAGADGVGMARVIPFDYEHASEMDPTEGSIPKGGAPAPAWALELQMRDGGELGPQLWALTDPVNEEVRLSLKQGGYRSTSVAIWNNAIDGVSGEELGPVLTSIAFTNHPFIEGMAPIAARVDVWGEAESPEELIVGLRDLFELDENAPPADIQAQLVALGVAFANGMTLPAYPEGVGPLIDRVRELIGLPVLSTAPQIIEAAGQLLTAVPTSQSPAAPATPTAPPSQGSYGMKTAIQKIATLFKLNEAAAEEVILAAVEKAASDGAASTDAISQLQALFGSSDTKDLIAKAGAAITAAESVKDLVASLQAAQDKLGEADKEAAAGEVEQVAASLGLSEIAKKRLQPVLLSQRIEAGKDPVKLAAWRTENGVTVGKILATAPKAVKLLTSTMLAGRGGSQIGNAVTFADTEGGEPHPLLSFAGRNNTEKAKAYLCSKRPGFDKLPLAKQLLDASKYLADGAPVL